MDRLESLDKTANELAENIQKLSTYVDTLRKEGHDQSATIEIINSTCRELDRINKEIKKLTSRKC